MAATVPYERLCGQRIDTERLPGRSAIWCLTCGARGWPSDSSGLLTGVPP